ncbi:MAG: peptidyl-prolyl cis-trans isomerase [Candidatus Kuenenia sp.]|nr:peptidyl-prolyl cis-trans isomerase [Candidatus Kuenenia sp.]
MNKKYLILPMAAMFSFGSFSTYHQSVSANSETSILLVSKESKEDKDVVAIVNGQNITSNELYELLLRSYGNEALDVLIRRTLINQEARKHGISLTTKEVENKINTLVQLEVNALMQTYKIENEADLDKELEKIGASLKEFKDKLTKKLVKEAEIELRAEKVVMKTISVSEEDLQEAYKSIYGEKIEAQQIVLKTKREAEEALEKLRLGADITKMAKAQSIDRASAARDGKMLPFSPEDDIGKSVAHLKPGELSSIISTNYGYHIIKITDRKTGSDKKFDTVKKELEDLVREKKYRERLRPWLVNLVESASITKKIAND